MSNLSIEEQMKACTQNSSGMFEVGEELMCAVVDHLIAIRELKGDQVPVGIVRKVQQGLHVTLYQSIPEGTELFTAPQKPIEHSDTRRMDWLCAHCVEVRDPQMYGSHAMFHAQQDSEEWDLPHHTTLREQVDAAIEAAGGIVKDGE